MRADFYLIAKPRFADDPLRLVCELAKRCHGTGQATLILCRDAEQAEALDEQLWAFEDDAYIPHQIAGLDDDDDVTPVLLATRTCCELPIHSPSSPNGPRYQ